MFEEMPVAPMAYLAGPLPPQIMQYRASVGPLTQAMLERQITPSLKPGTPEWDKAMLETAKTAILDQCATIWSYRRNHRKGEWLDPAIQKQVEDWLKDQGAPKTKKIDSRLIGARGQLVVWGSIDRDSVDGREMFKVALQQHESFGARNYQQTARKLLKQWAIRKARMEMEEEWEIAINCL